MEQQELEYIAGKHPVLEALRSGRTINKIWVAEAPAKGPAGAGAPNAKGTQKGGPGHGAGAIIAEARQLGIPIQMVDKRKLDQMVPDVQHQGVVAQAAAHGYAEPEDVLAAAKAEGETPFLLLLDEIEDPHNLGSILRTADCTGVHGVFIPKRRSAALTATVAKTSAGAIEYVPVAKVTNLAQEIDQLKEEGVWVVGTDVNATQSMYDADLTMPIAVVIGNEHQGIGRLIREKCDFLVKLPMVGHVGSLNASVAAGVVMYEVLRQRHAKRP